MDLTVSVNYARIFLAVGWVAAFLEPAAFFARVALSNFKFQVGRLGAVFWIDEHLAIL